MMASLINSGSQDLAQASPRQIRFVNNQGQPPTKRRRITAACLTCRKRKTRCSGEQPSCLTCTKNGHACLGYTETVDIKKEQIGDLAGRSDEASTSQRRSSLDDGAAETTEHEDPDEETETSSVPSLKTEAQRGGDLSQVPRRLPDDRPVPETGPAPGNVNTPGTVRLKSEKMDWEEPRQSPPPKERDEEQIKRPPNPRNTSCSTEGGHGASCISPLLHQTESYRVPYFRYFGPTAIVPGFKQMVVRVRDRRRSSISAASPSSGSGHTGVLSGAMSDHEAASTSSYMEDAPIYDPGDSAPVHPTILNLVDTFFTHLGGNYPFLRRDKFPAKVREKRVQPILVDAVCALAARFLEAPPFKKRTDGKLARSDYGHVFAQRAKAATVDTFPCPSVAAVQACLLMAYDGFGADQDSALWMYLGIAIRMAVDLGLTKEDGVKYQGERDRWIPGALGGRSVADDAKPSIEEEAMTVEEQKEVEQERIDTLWAVFFLDRVISSGTGRQVTLRDDDFELELPRPSVDPVSGWPDPLPELMQIIHLYGRVSDVLNNIRHAHDLTQEKLQTLVGMETELTRLHQRMDPRLRFDASNFQAYVKRGQSANFILLHVWFHALIIVLHQPTLLTSRGAVNRIHQLKSHSHELSMSSAKTIADILAFAELVDHKTLTGNPFTSQPIYIAANAFIMESSSASSYSASSGTATRNPATSSRAPAPTAESSGTATAVADAEPKPSRNALLASAANQNYHACYKALKHMLKYWGGVRYILAALDQKSEGIWDVETFTGDNDNAPAMAAHNSNFVRPRVSSGTPRLHPSRPDTSAIVSASSPMVASENGQPFAWSLTGTTNSPNSSFTLLFPGPQHHPPPHHQSSGSGMGFDPIRPDASVPPMFPPSSSPYPQPNTSALRHSVDPSDVARSGSISGSSAASHIKTVPPSTPDSAKLAGPLAVPASQHGLAHAPVFTTPSSQHSAGFDYRHTPVSPTAAGHRQMSSAEILTTGNDAAAAMYSSAGASQAAAATGVPAAFGQGGYQYFAGSGPNNLHFLTYDNETDIGQHLANFEPAEMMTWVGGYYPNEMLGLYPDQQNME